MIDYRILEDKGIVVIEPVTSLSSDDFLELTTAVDAYLADHEAVRGLLIHSEKFPGWESFAGFLAHIRFVRDHHKKIRRVALATDSPLGTVAQALAKHFVSAEVRHFAYTAIDSAVQWLGEE